MTTPEFTHWLTPAASDPHTALKCRQAGETATLLVGRQWDLVQPEFTLATAAISQLKARERHIGPYLMGGTERAMWWPLPLRTAHRLSGVPGAVVRPHGSELFVPPPGKYLGDRVWLIREPYTLTDADELRTAVCAARDGSRV
ncbi:hypothetical protein [Streptomyces orinoci]|uniref:Uncharacterized protein n=1 Tax=Streptomyces orinoci TaxID=67339 RepID=A0ABV3JWK6_STRON|nr:hypothetical protein [Streptomyces orinoci]